MGGLSCPIISCPLYKRGSCKSYTEDVKIHRFPINNSKVREKWEDFVSKQNGIPFKCKKNHGLCSAHFGARWIMPSGRITRDAIPTIAPVSTKKVLCKWDPESIKLVPVETETETESVAPFKVTDSEDVQIVINNNSIGGDIDTENDHEINSASPCISIPFSECSGDLHSSEYRSFFNSVENVKKQSESLDTIEGVENAIKCERKWAIARYKASMRKVQSLEVLLEKLKKYGNATSDSFCNIKFSSVPNLPSKTTPTSKTKLHKTHSKIPNLTPSLIRITSVGDSDLPPPLFDDYN